MKRPDISISEFKRDAGCVTVSMKNAILDYIEELEQVLSFKEKPTRLVRVEKCPREWVEIHTGIGPFPHPIKCECRGTGFIRTDLTAEQAVEAFTVLVKGKGWVNYYDNEPIERVFELPDGSRVEVKEKPK